MLIFLLIAFLGGAASVLTPCVLPLLPAVFAVSAGEGKGRLWGIVVGIITSFLGIAIILASLFKSLPADTLPTVAAMIMVLFGLVLIVPKLEHLFQRSLQGVVSRVPQAGGGDGFVGGLLSGLTLGVVWAPCAGPILASITTGASSLGTCTSQTVLTMLAYGLGMSIPLVLLVFGGHRFGMFLRKVFGSGRKVSVVMGVILVATGVLYGAVGLNNVNRKISETLNISSTPIAGLERTGFSKRSCHMRAGEKASTTDSDDTGNRPPISELQANGYPTFDDGELHDLGKAPEFVGNERWYNTSGNKALTMEGLRGKVVLIDFWTYSCVNCIRTLPHLRDLYAKYKDKGLVIVGVHAPEFQFEKDPENVKDAVDDLDVTWPVALDNEMATWNAYYNNYWPAHYIIDKDGLIRATHYGEGAYAETEDLVRQLLKLPAMDTSGNDDDRPGSFHDITPESYLGISRANPEQFAGEVGDVEGLQYGQATYAAPEKSRDFGLDTHQWTYTGNWLVEEERSVAGKDARLILHYSANDVFLVLGPPEDGSNGSITVQDGDGKSRRIVIDGHRLYTLRDTDEKYTDQILRITVDAGVSVYAFTFG